MKNSRKKLTLIQLVDEVTVLTENCEKQLAEITKVYDLGFIHNYSYIADARACTNNYYKQLAQLCEDNNYSIEVIQTIIEYNAMKN